MIPTNYDDDDEEDDMTGFEVKMIRLLHMQCR